MILINSINDFLILFDFLNKLILIVPININTKNLKSFNTFFLSINIIIMKP